MAERILCVLGKLRSGGVESMMFSYYKFLDKEKYQYDFVYEEGSEYDVPAELIEMGARAYKVSAVSSPIKYIGDIRRIIKENGYRIVHSNLNTLSFFSLFAAWQCSVKYRILHNHSTSSGIEKKRDIIKKILRPFNRMLTTSPCACSELAARWMYGDRAFEKGNIKVFRNGVDPERFSYNREYRSEIRKEFNLENKRVIGHIGRFMTQKNHLFIIDIFCEYAKRDDTAVLMLVGSGELFDSVQEYAKKKGVYDKIIFTGVRKDVEKLYSAFDVFILPSLYEGLPIVSMEACASGLPVLLSDAITRECAVSDNVHFLAIEDPGDWAEKIISVNCLNREESASLMKNGPYDIRKCTKILEDYYAGCC